MSRSSRRPGLSLIEMMIALTISITLLTSALVALDTMFKGYQVTTESASTHVVSRIVMTRVLGMIRTGSDFGPVPDDVLDAGSNPIHADYFEFASAKDEAGAVTRITRIEFRRFDRPADLLTWGPGDERPVPEDEEAPPEGGEPGGPGETGPGAEPPEGEEPEPAPSDEQGELWFVLLEPGPDGGEIIEQHPLLRGVASARFTLQYDIGPKLIHATIDLTIAPNDSRDLTLHSDNVPPTIRLVASAAPRQSIE